tara:strand:+ start:161 stop:493 length:333 start_codon:yes stop_codon:yes gene_type:complete
MIPQSDSYILVTNNNDNYTYFHPKTIFNKLTVEHVMKLFLIQKIKLKGNIKTKIEIYLDGVELESMDLKRVKKLLDKSENYFIYFKDVNDIDIEKVKLYREFIDKYKRIN